MTRFPRVPRAPRAASLHPPPVGRIFELNFSRVAGGRRPAVMHARLLDLDRADAGLDRTPGQVAVTHHLTLAGAADAAGVRVDPRGGFGFDGLREHLLRAASQHPRQFVLAHGSSIAARQRRHHAGGLPGHPEGMRLWNQTLVTITLLHGGVLLALRIGGDEADAVCDEIVELMFKNAR